MPVRPDDPRPPYLQLADELRKAIHNGDYQPGDRLPSRRQLAEVNGIAEMTVQHAIDVLADEGLVVAQHGRGVFAQAPPASRSEQPEDEATEVPRLRDALDEALKELAEANERLARYEAAGIELPEPDIHPTPAPETSIEP